MRIHFFYATVAVSLFSCVAHAVPLAGSYSIDTLGFTDAEHTSTDGRRFSSAKKDTLLLSLPRLESAQYNENTGIAPSSQESPLVI